MKVVCAPNALKGTLGAQDAAEAMALGVRRVAPDAEIVRAPIADGGDGTCAILSAALGGDRRTATVTDPLGRAIVAAYGLVDGGRTALIDVASASGLALLAPAERDPRAASSFGTGELLVHALRGGARSVILGVGGSATVDGGMGLLAALGVRFLDDAGRALRPCGATLQHVAQIEIPSLAQFVRQAELLVACDVNNPLLGLEGAARVFGPQKGADPQTVELLEAGLSQFAQVLGRVTGVDVAELPYGGAAGGIAAALHAVLGARLVPGADLVLDRIGFDSALVGADLVLTAEGRLDASSLSNKGPHVVAVRAKRVGAPTICLAGAIADDFAISRSEFADAIALTQEPVDIVQARRETSGWLARGATDAIHRFRNSEDRYRRLVPK